MIDLVRKRHEGDGWLVFEEVGDKPGYHRDRTADAIALGVWASKKYEAHLYEFKISREDVKREIRDPSKVEGVGKYCTYWWLAISDEKIINELIVPEAWGIVVKKPWGDKGEFRLHTLRKAPRQKPQAIGVMFAVSLIRNMRKNYVDPSEHKKLKDELDKIKYGPASESEAAKYQLESKVADLEREIRRTKDMIGRFETASGVELGAPSWDYGPIGEAVAVVKRMADATRVAAGNVLPEIAVLSKTAEDLERRARELARAAIDLRAIQGATDHSPRCATKRGWGGGRCDCGLVPLSEVEKKLAADASLPSSSGTPECAGLVMAGNHRGSPCQYCGHVTPAAPRGDDDEGGGVDRGGSRPPE